MSQETTLNIYGITRLTHFLPERQSQDLSSGRRLCPWLGRKSTFPCRFSVLPNSAGSCYCGASVCLSEEYYSTRYVVEEEVREFSVSRRDHLLAGVSTAPLLHSSTRYFLSAAEQHNALNTSPRYGWSRARPPPAYASADRGEVPASDAISPITARDLKFPSASNKCGS